MTPEQLLDKLGWVCQGLIPRMRSTLWVYPPTGRIYRLPHGGVGVDDSRLRQEIIMLTPEP